MTDLYKKKVWSCSAYLTEGCGKPKTNKRCNTPHSNRYGVRVQETHSII